MRALISKACVLLNHNFAYNNCNSVQVFDLSVSLFCSKNCVLTALTMHFYFFKKLVSAVINISKKKKLY